MPILRRILFMKLFSDLFKRTSSFVRSTAAVLLCTIAPLSFIVLINSAQAERQLTGAITLSSKDRVSIILDRERADDGTYVVLKVVLPKDVKINAFMLPSPPRIVLDLDGASVRKSETFLAPTNGIVKQVRLGSHPGKLRIVVDLLRAEAPKYDWKAGKRQVILRMLEEAAESVPAPIAPLVQALSQIEQSEALPAKDSGAPDSLAVLPQLPAGADVASAPSETLGLTEQIATIDTPASDKKVSKLIAPKQGEIVLEKEVLPEPIKEQALDLGGAKRVVDSKAAAANLATIEKNAASPLAPAAAIKIIGYRFEYMEPNKTPVLKISLNSDKAKAQISKVDGMTYKIVIPTSKLANEDLVLPQFPPADFVGFIMVVTEEVSDSVEITVSVEEGTSITTLVRGDEIWVQPPGV